MERHDETMENTEKQDKSRSAALGPPRPPPSPHHQTRDENLLKFWLLGEMSTTQPSRNKRFNFVNIKRLVSCRHADPREFLISKGARVAPSSKHIYFAIVQRLLKGNC